MSVSQIQEKKPNTSQNREQILGARKLKSVFIFLKTNPICTAGSYSELETTILKKIRHNTNNFKMFYDKQLGSYTIYL